MRQKKEGRWRGEEDRKGRKRERGGSSSQLITLRSRAQIQTIEKTLAY